MRKILGFLSLLFMFVLPNIVDAASVSVGLDCPYSATAGETISCSINMNSDVKVNGLVVNYSFNGASYVSFTPQAGFSSNYDSKDGFNIGNRAGRSGSYTIGTLKVKVTSAATVTIKNIDVSDIDFNSYSPLNKSVTVKLKSTNNNLGGLSLVGGSLSPAFNANTTNYTATVNASSVTINATKGESSQTITGTGKKTLKYGKNTFNVVVKSEAGTSKTYTIVITRPDSRKSDNYLSSLSIDKGSISFKKDTLNYSVSVASDVSSVKVSATVNDSTAKFVNGYGPRSVNLKYGVNSIVVKVQAENESVRTYTIKVTREDGRSSNTNLSSISLSNGNINFSKSVTEYSVSVPYEVTKISVIANAEDSKSKVNVVSPDLVVGKNTITITVTSEIGDSKVYKIFVTRLEEQVVLSDNNNVSSIDVKGHGIEFDPDTKEYNVNIGDEYALVIDVLLEDPSAKYVIEGNEDLKDGSVIKITSTSASGEIKEYKLNIKKQVEANPSGGLPVVFYVLIGFVLGLVTMFVTLTLVNKMKSKDNAKQVAVKSVAVQPVVEPKKVAVQPVAPAPKPAPAPTAAPKPAPAAAPTPAPAPVTTASVEEKKAVETTVAPAPANPVATTASAPAPAAEKPVSKEAAPAPVQKPAMQEAAVSQPVSQTVNVIPENK
jgi:hypothetical protein